MNALLKTLLAGTSLLLATGVTAGEKLIVAATPVPHAEVLAFIKPKLAAQGVDIEVKVFTDYVQPNLQVEQKRIDVSYFQTLPYLQEFNKARGSALVPIAGIHIEPFGAYSKKHKSLKDLPEGATIAIPNEVSNSGRALLLLAKAGVITLKDASNTTSTPRDIASNPKKLKFRELEAAMLPRILPQVDVALINTNYALEAKLNPQKDALIIEDSKSPYVNYLVGRADNQHAPAVKKLAAALQSPEVAEFIRSKYQGAVVPAF